MIKANQLIFVCDSCKRIKSFDQLVGQKLAWKELWEWGWRKVWAEGRLIHFCQACCFSEGKTVYFPVRKTRESLSYGAACCSTLTEDAMGEQRR